MKIRLLSDLHLEFEDFEIPYVEGDEETVLILAGDIHTGLKAQHFIRDACAQFYRVVFVLGNHEFYGADFHMLPYHWVNLARNEMPTNFHFLHKFAPQPIDDVLFVGDTLWTNIPKRVADTYAHVLNDYNCIKYRDRRITPLDTTNAHINQLLEFDATLKVTQGYFRKTVMVTHHLPTYLCVEEKFKNSPLNPFFVTELDEFIHKHDINVWCHGHTHANVYQVVNGTRILCNPKGYRDENKAGFDPKFTFEV